jgi:hypothetical protein
MNLINIIKRHNKGASVSVEDAFAIISEYCYDKTGSYPTNVRFQNRNSKHMQQVNHALSVAVLFFSQNEVNLGQALVRTKNK